MDRTRFSADPTHSVPTRPIRSILTRARASEQASERTNGQASERRPGRAGEVGPRRKSTEVGVDSRIDVDTLAFQSHSPNGHRRVKSLHLLPLSGCTGREKEPVFAVGSRPFAQRWKKTKRKRKTNKKKTRARARKKRKREEEASLNPDCGSRDSRCRDSTVVAKNALTGYPLSRCSSRKLLLRFDIVDERERKRN